MTFHWWHIVILILPMLPTFWSIWDVWTHDFRDRQQKMLWLCLVVFMPVIGGIIYIFTGRGLARASAPNAQSHNGPQSPGAGNNHA